jgi:hypothetical protein
MKTAKKFKKGKKIEKQEKGARGRSKKLRRQSECFWQQRGGMLCLVFEGNMDC